MQGAVIVSADTTLSQVFNVAHNNLTGSVPAFLAASDVPTLSKQGVSLVVMLCYPALVLIMVYAPADVRPCL